MEDFESACSYSDLESVQKAHTDAGKPLPSAVCVVNACGSNKIEVVRWLLDAKGDPNAKIEDGGWEDGTTALCKALKRYDDEEGIQVRILCS